MSLWKKLLQKNLFQLRAVSVWQMEKEIIWGGDLLWDETKNSKVKYSKALRCYQLLSVVSEKDVYHLDNCWYSRFLSSFGGIFRCTLAAFRQGCNLSKRICLSCRDKVTAEEPKQWFRHLSHTFPLEFDFLTNGSARAGEEKGGSLACSGIHLESTDDSLNNMTTTQKMLLSNQTWWLQATVLLRKAGALFLEDYLLCQQLNGT